MMMSKNVKENEVKKIVPSKLENAFYPIVYHKFGRADGAEGRRRGALRQVCWYRTRARRH